MFLISWHCYQKPNGLHHEAEGVIGNVLMNSVSNWCIFHSNIITFTGLVIILNFHHMMIWFLNVVAYNYK